MLIIPSGDEEKRVDHLVKKRLLQGQKQDVNTS